MLPKASNAFMTHPDVTPAERRMAIQYRCGQLYNAKLGKRWGHTTSDRCPLCHDQDGGHHIASGCRKLSALYTTRHHKAGRIILKAILQGTRAAEVAFADVGKEDNLTADGLPPIDPRHNIRLPRHSSRPDILLVSKSRQRITSITIVELKYCRDSDPDQQLRRASSQHTQLQQDLATQHQCHISLHPILLGTSGAIYSTHTKAALKTLGVEGGALTKTVRNLHLHAVHSLQGIVSTRRRQERRQTHSNHRSNGMGGTNQASVRPDPTDYG